MARKKKMQHVGPAPAPELFEQEILGELTKEKVMEGMAIVQARMDSDYDPSNDVLLKPVTWHKSKSVPCPVCGTRTVEAVCEVDGTRMP